MTEKHPFLHHRSRRFHVILMLMYAFFCLAMMTSHIGMSLSCMCNSTTSFFINQKNNSFSTTTTIQPFYEPYLNESIDKSCTSVEGTVITDYGGNLDWSVKQQSNIVSATFFGGFLLAYPAGIIVDRFSARHILSFSVILLTFSTFTLPFFSQIFGAYGAMISRLFMGFSEALLVPGLNSMVTKWIPIHEKSLAAALFTSGNQVSGIIGNPIVAGICASSFSWPAIFYTCGIFGLIWLVLWHFTVRNSPTNTKWIHEKELIYLEKNLPPKHQKGSNEKKTPWNEMLKSGAVWAVVYNSVVGNMMIALIFIYIPVYFKDVLMFDVKSNGFYSAMPHLSNLITKISWGYFMDKLRQKNIFSPTTTVKLSQFLSMVGISISCFFLRFMDCTQPITAVFLLSMVSACFGLSISGLYTSLLSIAPSHIGILTSIATVIGFMGRFIAPMLISIFKTVGTAEEWGKIFLVYLFASLSGAIIFQIFGSGSIQRWDWSKTHSNDQNTNCENLEKETLKN